MSDEEEDLGTMAWPGFVDILSSVIIMFVFFVMVVASALYFHIIIFKSQILSEVNQANNSKASEVHKASADSFMSEEIKDVEEDAKLLDKPTDENNIVLYQEQTQFEESEFQEMDVLQENKEFVIFFGSSAISVTEKMQNQISKFLSDAQINSKTKIRIISGKKPDVKNEVITRQLAVSRMLNIRNMFVTSNADMANVKLTVSSDEEINDTYNYVKVLIEGE